MPGTFKKLVLVLATSASITKASKEDEVILERVPCIHYSPCFRKNKKNEVQALIGSDNKINTMTLIYAAKLGLKVRHTNIKA